MKSFTTAEILSNKEIAENIFEMNILVPEISNEAKPGQFINIYTGLGENILPRPISISEIDKEKGSLTLIYQIAGKGTKVFSSLKENDKVQVLGPLGNGFEISEKEGTYILVGGGIGAPPLVEVAKNLKGRIIVFLGSRSNPILVEKFQFLGAEVNVATDDGSVGFKGNVVELMKEINLNADAIYSCGPKIMLKFLSEWALEKGIDAQVSMEERMACGIGACVGCAVKIKKDNGFENKKVCKDGPVFKGSEVIWDE